MAGLGYCTTDELPQQLNARQRTARTGVGLASLALALFAPRQSGALSVIGVLGAGWFGASHLVAARTGYAGCPEPGRDPERNPGPRRPGRLRALANR
ncbi:MAG: hypothetical protein ACR2OB_01025 [Solirubrobacteraceae bacterium]